jgi:putative transposase
VPEPYPAKFRRRALDLVDSARIVREVAAVLGIAESCLYGGKPKESEASTTADDGNRL